MYSQFPPVTSSNHELLSFLNRTLKIPVSLEALNRVTSVDHVGVFRPTEMHHLRLMETDYPH